MAQFAIWFQLGYIPHQAQNSPQGSQHTDARIPHLLPWGFSIWPLPKGETARKTVKGQHHEFTHFTRTSPSPWLRTSPAWIRLN